MHLNGAALAIAEPLCARPATVGAALHIVGGARVLDCGVAAAGGSEAGLGMARVALGGLGSVTLEPGGRPGAAPLPGWPDCPWPVVTVSSDAPVAACLAAQYAGWRVKEAGYFAMASGPIRAAIGREELYDDIGMRERSSAVVGLLEALELAAVRLAGAGDNHRLQSISTLRKEDGGDGCADQRERGSRAERTTRRAEGSIGHVLDS